VYFLFVGSRGLVVLKVLYFCSTLGLLFFYVTRGVSHYGLAIYVKNYLKAKKKKWKLEYFTMPKYNFQKILQKKPKSFKI
jgi:hypothetical protein